MSSYGIVSYLMSDMDSSHFLSLFFSLLLLHSSLVHSRTLSPPSIYPKTAILDVADSLENTLNVFNLNIRKTTPLNLNQLLRENVNQEKEKLSLQLHPRAALETSPPHAEYRSLTLSRLARDNARVDSLTAELDPALMPSSTKADALQGPVVSGASQGSGEYFCRLGIGDPASQVYMVIDTGSDVSWVQCAPCADCYQQADPIFEPGKSSSFSSLSCDTPQCKSLDVSECRNGTCLYEVSYGDGSYTVGDFVTETITLGSTKVADVAIGCGHSNEGLFIGAAGLLGLGGGSLSFPSQVNASSFSYCLVDRDSDSASTLEFDWVIPPNAVTAPLLRNPQVDTFLYVGITGISVGGEPLAIPEDSFRITTNGDGGMIIDSGTAVTRLQTEVYGTLRDAFVNGTRDLRSTEGVALFDTCYDLSGTSSVEVPTVSFRFGEGKEWVLPARNYMIPVDSNGTFCFAFASTASALSIMGNVQQQGTRVGFDLRNSLVGFVPNKC